MTTYTTRTAEFGPITFSAPAADENRQSYVWAEINGQRRQICHGGVFLGSAVTATTSNLKKEAQKWLRQRRDWMRNA